MSVVYNSAIAQISHTNALTMRLQRAFGGGFTLDVELALPPGITVLFGPSGAGKTTILDCVAGLTRPDYGRIAIGERVLFDSVPRFNEPVELRRVGYVFQDLALFPHLSVQRNVEYGLRGVRQRRERVRALLERFRIAQLRDRKPSEISGGERQRVALARALVTDPCVLLLDEPLAGLDLPTRSGLMDDLREWNRIHQVPVLYVTHAREELVALGERVVVLEKGRVIAQGTPHEVLDAPRHELTAGLAGVENVFEAVVIALHEDEGTMTCRLQNDAAGSGHVHVEAPLARIATPGARLRVGIRAGDILLATAQPQGLSARNLLRGHIFALKRRDLTVVAQVDCGVLFEVHVTPAAERELELQPGKEVWIVIKTHSCNLLHHSWP